METTIGDEYIRRLGNYCSLYRAISWNSPFHCWNINRCSKCTHQSLFFKSPKKTESSPIVSTFRELARLIFLCNNMWCLFVNIHYRKIFQHLQNFRPPKFRWHLLKGLLGFPLQIPSHAVFAVDLRWWLLVGDVLISRLRHLFVQHFCLPAKLAKNREPEVEFSKTALRRFYPPIELVSDFPQPQEQTFYFLFARSQNSEKSKTKLFAKVLDDSPRLFVYFSNFVANCLAWNFEVLCGKTCFNICWVLWTIGNGPQESYYWRSGQSWQDLFPSSVYSSNVCVV